VQVVERHLVDELDRIFNVTRVVELDDAAVIEIASEDESLRHHRIELRNTRRILEAGERICRKYMTRRDLKLDPELRSNSNTASNSSTSRPTVGRVTRRGANRPYNPESAQSSHQPPSLYAGAEADPLRSPINNFHEDIRSQHQGRPTTPTFSNPSVLNRQASRATTETHRTSTNGAITTPTTEDSYNSAGYNTQRHDPAPSYGPYDPTQSSGYVPAPAVPPRPANQPPLPPKRTEDEPGHGTPRGGPLRNVFGRK